MSFVFKKLNDERFQIEKLKLKRKLRVKIPNF